MKMARIGSLEFRTIRRGTKVVKLPGHEFEMEHFLPQNHEHVEISGRVKVIRSKIGTKPIFIKKRQSTTGPTLTAVSELRLARHINNLNIPGIRVEEPLAAILHSTGRQSVIYRKKEGQMETSKWAYSQEKALSIEEELQKHGITPFDLQWFEHSDGITIFDIEDFKVTPELKRKLRLKYLNKKVLSA